MKKLFVTILLGLLLVVPGMAQNVKEISGEIFRERVFDYKSDEGWAFKGERACLVDFSTSWCGWCKRQEPIFDALAKEFKGQIDFYKIDCEKNPDLAHVLGINS